MNTAAGRISYLPTLYLAVESGIDALVDATGCLFFYDELEGHCHDIKVEIPSYEERYKNTLKAAPSSEIVRFDCWAQGTENFG